jgi:hypothetical protein
MGSGCRGDANRVKIAPCAANDAVRVAVVGLNGKGAHHVQMLRAIPGVRLVALCDADETSRPPTTGTR